jgi:hypothetical protein
MKSSRIQIIAVLAIFGGQLLFADVSAVDLNKISIDGQVRLRSIYNQSDYWGWRLHRIYHDLRTRLGVRIDPTEWTFVYLQLQNSRRLGEPSSGDLTDSAVVNMHQAYFEIRDLVFPDIRLQAGRFEMVYGNQRVFGSDNWGNVGRVWDGARLSYVGDKLRIDGFYLKRKELNATDENRDFDVMGVYSTISPVGLDLFWFYELNADSAFDGSDKLHRHNIGLYVKRQSLDSTRYLILQGNYQFGKIPVVNRLFSGTEDISAYMFNWEAGVGFYGRLPGRAKAGIDYSSGDNMYNKGTEDTYSAYASDYYSSHRFQGYMDLFAYVPTPQSEGRVDYSSVHGLLDLYAGVQMYPIQRWMTALDVHYFRAADYYAESFYRPRFTKKLGPEIDLSTEYDSNRGAIFTAGFSIFFPESAHIFYPWPDNDQRPALWGYLMTTVTF